MNDKRDQGQSVGSDELELIAGYLDGVLSDEDREAAEALLARSEPAREVLAEAVRLADDFGERTQDTPGPGRVQAAQPPRLRRWRWALAASAAAVLLLSVPMLRPGPSGTQVVIGTLDVALVTAQAGWADPVWPVVRGEEVTGGLQATFRAGVRWTDFLVAWKAGDSDEARRMLHGIVDLVEPVPISGPVLSVLRQVDAAVSAGGLVAASRREVRTASDMLETTGPGFELGLWVEMARLGAIAADTALLNDRALRRGLTRLAKETWPAEVHQPLSAVVAALPNDHPGIARAAEELASAVR